MIREHPLIIWKNAFKNVWMLIFPLLRGIRNYHLNIDVFYNWIKGAWFDLLVLIAIIGFGLARWLFTGLSFDEENITLMSGIFIKKKTNIPIKNISAVDTEYPLLLKPFKAVKVKISTRGGALNNTDMSILIRKKDSLRLRRKISFFRGGFRKKARKKQHILSIIFFSFVFSNSISGAIYVSTLFFQLGKASKSIIEVELKDAVNLVTNEVSSKLALSIPPAALTVGILIIAAWLISFAANIIRYSRFSIKKSPSAIEVKMGLVTTRNYHIVNNKINYLDMRFTMIMTIFRKTSLHISCSGYGNRKNELPVLIPVLGKSRENETLQLLGFGKKIAPPDIRADRSAVITYIGLPTAFLAGIPLLAHTLIRLLPNYAHFVIPFAVMAEIPTVWMTAVKVIALLTTAVSVGDDSICITYSRFFSFHKVIADKKKVVKIQVVQNPIQKLIGRCRIDFYFSSEIPKKNKLHGMKIGDAKRLMGIFSESIG